MKFKRGVEPKYLSAPAWYGLHLADEVHKSMANQDAVCTSTGDSKHTVERSRHYTGEYGYGFCHAWDLRVWHVDQQEYAKRLRRRLGKDYVVVVESDHIHCHFAPTFTS